MASSCPQVRATSSTWGLRTGELDHPAPAGAIGADTRSPCSIAPTARAPDAFALTSMRLPYPSAPIARRGTSTAALSTIRFRRRRCGRPRAAAPRRARPCCSPQAGRARRSCLARLTAFAPLGAERVLWRRMSGCTGAPRRNRSGRPGAGRLRVLRIEETLRRAGLLAVRKSHEDSACRIPTCTSRLGRRRSATSARSGVATVDCEGAGPRLDGALERLRQIRARRGRPPADLVCAPGT